MFNKILFGVIGALAALLVFVLAVMLLTSALGFQIVAVLELGINIVAGFICWKKFQDNEIIRALSMGVLASSIFYLLIIFIAKTVVFSLLSGITA